MEVVAVVDLQNQSVDLAKILVAAAVGTAAALESRFAEDTGSPAGLDPIAT